MEKIMANDELRDKMFEKLKKGLKPKYINDLELMKDFNGAANPITQLDKIDYFFNEMTRLFLEFQMCWTTPYNFQAGKYQLNRLFDRTLKILEFDFKEAQKRRTDLHAH